MGFKDFIMDDDFDLDRIINNTAFSWGIGNELQKRNILRNIKHYERVRVRGNNINNLRHADGTVLIADLKSCKKILQQSQSKVKTKDLK